MRLCMFHPVDRPMERGWVGRIDDDQVVHLAAQTLQSFFTGGGTAREHDVYPLEAVRLLAPVLHPPAVRIFDEQESFSFANPAAIVGPESVVAARPSPRGSEPRGDRLMILPRLAAVVGANEAIGGFTALAEWRAPSRRAPKDRDFALGLGPTVVTRDAFRPDGVGALVRVGAGLELTGAFVGFDWAAALALAREGTILKPGDLLAGPALGIVDVGSPGTVEIEVESIGILAATVAS